MATVILHFDQGEPISVSVDDRLVDVVSAWAPRLEPRVPVKGLADGGHLLDLRSVVSLEVHLTEPA